MTKKNIILTSILLVILTIIIGIGFDIAKAETLAANPGLQKSATTNSVPLLGKVDHLDKLLVTKTSVLHPLSDKVVSHDVILNVDAKGLLGVHKNLLGV